MTKLSFELDQTAQQMIVRFNLLEIIFPQCETHFICSKKRKIDIYAHNSDLSVAPQDFRFNLFWMEIEFSLYDSIQNEKTKSISFEMPLPNNRISKIKKIKQRR